MYAEVTKLIKWKTQDYDRSIDIDLVLRIVFLRHVKEWTTYCRTHS